MGVVFYRNWGCVSYKSVVCSHFPGDLATKRTHLCNKIGNEIGGVLSYSQRYREQQHGSPTNHVDQYNQSKCCQTASGSNILLRHWFTESYKWPATPKVKNVWSPKPKSPTKGLASLPGFPLSLQLPQCQSHELPERAQQSRC